MGFLYVRFKYLENEEVMQEQISAIMENQALSFNQKIDAIERILILDALEKNGWVKLKAARQLKATYRIFNYKCSKYGLDKRNGDSLRQCLENSAANN